jgi:peroxiredoxin Q/BCP
VVGVSPDSPRKQKNFDAKFELGFPLLSDPDHKMAAAYGTWGEKKMYGKTYEGILRSAFLVGADGRLQAVWYKISPKNTVPELMKALQG